MDPKEATHVKVSALYNAPIVFGAKTLTFTFEDVNIPERTEYKPYETLGFIHIYNSGYYAYNVERPATVTLKNGETVSCPGESSTLTNVQLINCAKADKEIPIAQISTIVWASSGN